MRHKAKYLAYANGRTYADSYYLEFVRWAHARNNFRISDSLLMYWEHATPPMGCYGAVYQAIWAQGIQKRG